VVEPIERGDLPGANRLDLFERVGPQQCFDVESGHGRIVPRRNSACLNASAAIDLLDSRPEQSAFVGGTS
jgi:hypothetical protein